jgi:hypothetical protein
MPPGARGARAPKAGAIAVVRNQALLVWSSTLIWQESALILTSAALLERRVPAPLRW